MLPITKVNIWNLIVKCYHTFFLDFLKEKEHLEHYPNASTMLVYKKKIKPHRTIHQLHSVLSNVKHPALLALF